MSDENSTEDSLRRVSLQIAPLVPIPVEPLIAALPKADLHIHQEWSPRLDRVLARRQGRSTFDWRAWAEQLMMGELPGWPRLSRIASIQPVPVEMDAAEENFVARIEDLLEEAAIDGAVLVEVRFGNETVLHPDFMGLFRQAERRVQARFPLLRAEAVVTLNLWFEPERLEQVVQGSLRAAEEGLGGVDFLYRPYGDGGGVGDGVQHRRANGYGRTWHHRARGRSLDGQHRLCSGHAGPDPYRARYPCRSRSPSTGIAGGQRSYGGVPLNLQRCGRSCSILCRASHPAVRRKWHTRCALYR